MEGTDDGAEPFVMARIFCDTGHPAEPWLEVWGVELWQLRTHCGAGVHRAAADLTVIDPSAKGEHR